ncbi:MAG: hypothetical protein LC749_09730 [Actinobacteria bacterium]|nr:hypothetical protein [Actinomycetota bacterium]
MIGLRNAAPMIAHRYVSARHSDWARIFGMLVRARNDDDLDRCVEIACAVRRLDGYPPHLPGDLRAFIAGPEIGAWVADLDGEAIGYFALHRHSSPR